jgi:hypothetical protein
VQPTNLLLPPAVCAVLDTRIDVTGVLPPNMISAIVARIYADPAARERLHTTAQGLLDHLLSDEPGWGNWPEDVGEAIYTSILLKTWLRDALVAQRLGMTKEELDKLEQSILERITKRKDGEEPTL